MSEEQLVDECAVVRSTLCSEPDGGSDDEDDVNEPLSELARRLAPKPQPRPALLMGKFDFWLPLVSLIVLHRSGARELRCGYQGKDVFALVNSFMSNGMRLSLAMFASLWDTMKIPCIANGTSYCAGASIRGIDPRTIAFTRSFVAEATLVRVDGDVDKLFDWLVSQDQSQLSDPLRRIFEANGTNDVSVRYETNEPVRLKRKRMRDSFAVWLKSETERFQEFEESGNARRPREYASTRAQGTSAPLVARSSSSTERAAVTSQCMEDYEASMQAGLVTAEERGVYFTQYMIGAGKSHLWQKQAIGGMVERGWWRRDIPTGVSNIRRAATSVNSSNVESAEVPILPTTSPERDVNLEATLNVLAHAEHEHVNGASDNELDELEQLENAIEHVSIQHRDMANILADVSPNNMREQIQRLGQTMQSNNSKRPRVSSIDAE